MRLLIPLIYIQIQSHAVKVCHSLQSAEFAASTASKHLTRYGIVLPCRSRAFDKSEWH